MSNSEGHARYINLLEQGIATLPVGSPMRKALEDSKRNAQEEKTFVGRNNG